MRLDVAVLVARGDGRLAVREIDAGDLDLVAHFGALAFGFVDQDLVEVGTLHLVGETVAGREFLREIEFVVLAVVQKRGARSEEHTSELQSLMRISYAVFCLKKKTTMIKNL